MTRLTLYGKPGCCLCEEAREAIETVRAERPLELEEVDVSLDPALHRRYGERIPVVAIDGLEVLELQVQPAALRRLLGGPRSTVQ
jgi:glutaredoxin